MLIRDSTTMRQDRYNRETAWRLKIDKAVVYFKNRKEFIYIKNYQSRKRMSTWKNLLWKNYLVNLFFRLDFYLGGLMRGKIETENPPCLP